MSGKRERKREGDVAGRWRDDVAAAQAVPRAGIDAQRFLSRTEADMLRGQYVDLRPIGNGWLR